METQPSAAPSLPPTSGLTLAEPAGQSRDLRAVGLAAVALLVAGTLLDLGVLCPLRRLTGVPCPLCGVTTGLGELAHLDLTGARRAHPLAPAVAAFLAVAWTPWGPAAVAALRRRTPALAALLGVVWAARLAGLYGS